MRFKIGNVFGMEDSFTKAGCDGGFGMDFETGGGETLDSLDTCQHHGAGQILTTTICQ